ncbi:MAG TPA: TlpA disulfide reductase family protein [Anaerolineales bacterium]|nr:TlpA disulfide reductase family protein [Anaerolineales bacterium]
MNWIVLLKDQRRWTFMVVIALSLGAGWTLLSRVPSTAANSGAQPASPRQGFAAPDFTLDLLGGGKVTLSDLRGKPIVVNLWASWCPPCRAEMPAIEKVYQDYKDLGLVVLGVNTTNQDSEADAATFVRQYGLTFPIPLDRDGSVSVRYALRGLPTTFFIDRKGVIRSVVVGGPMSEAVIRSNVEDLLKETP